MEILIPIAVVLGIIIFFMYASKSGAKLLKEREEKINRAESGKAKILGYIVQGLRGTGNAGRYQAVKFTLEVWSAYKSPYKTTTVWEVYDMGAPLVQEGMEVNVKIDADDPMIVYPSVNSVSYSWLGSQLLKKREKPS